MSKASYVRCEDKTVSPHVSHSLFIYRMYQHHCHMIFNHFDTLADRKKKTKKEHILILKHGGLLSNAILTSYISDNFSNCCLDVGSDCSIADKTCLCTVCVNVCLCNTGGFIKLQFLAAMEVSATQSMKQTTRWATTTKWQVCCQCSIVS